MRFMLIVKADKDSEAGVLPSRELLAEMGKYNEEAGESWRDAGRRRTAGQLQGRPGPLCWRHAHGGTAKFLADGASFASLG